jgi:DNA-binding transcriptional regulator YiaG
MPNIAQVLKEEIARLARKELRANTDSLKRAVSTYRSEIAALKRRVEQLERQAKRTAKSSKVSRPEVEQADGQHRWSAARFAQHRKRFGLSSADFGKLLGASALSVYKWESGQVRPRDKYLPAIADLRKLGKREAGRRLATLT